MISELLQRNEEHVENLDESYFADVQDGQEPAVVSVCCSDSRVSQEDMFDASRPGWLFTPSNIGNQAVIHGEDESYIDGNLLYPVAHTGTRTIAVVGHTSCGAVTAAYNAVQDNLNLEDEPEGIRRMVRQLVPIVEDAITEGAVDTHDDDATVINQLVEYNVDHQVQGLLDADEVPQDADVYGMVYDFQGVYGDKDGVTYLINKNGENNPAALIDEVEPAYADHVKRLGR